MGISSLVGAGISAAGSLFGASEKSDAAEQAAQAQAVAGQNAQNALTGALQTSTSDLQPYTGPGSNAANLLNNDLSTVASSSTAPTQRYVDPSQYATSADPYVTDGTANNISAAPYATTTNLDQSQLEQTPGYQFTEEQGLKGVQNSAAARGLGVSGAALKGAATYSTGLANNTYQTQYQDELSSNAQNFSQANTAANTDFNQQATANEQNFSNDLNANKQNISNALTGAAQNYGMDQTSDFTDQQQGKAQSASILSGAEGLGLQATGQQVNANTATAESTANALTGVGSAQAAADNATGQAYGSALTGLGTTAANALTSYNTNALSAAGSTTTTNADGSKTTTPNYAGASTLGNVLTGALKTATS